MRLGSRLPKQFVEVAGHPMITHSIKAFEASAPIQAIIVVLPEERPSFVDEEIRSEKIVSVTSGGPTRQASLSEGLTCLPEGTGVVLIHDAARPMVTPELVERVVEGVADEFVGAICGLPVEDALKEVSSEGEITSARRREGLWRAQTPQAFLRRPLEESLARADAEGIAGDDCSEIVTRAGYKVRAVMGDPLNIKVTFKRDLILCEKLLGGRAAGSESK